MFHKIFCLNSKFYHLLPLCIYESRFTGSIDKCPNLADFAVTYGTLLYPVAEIQSCLERYAYASHDVRPTVAGDLILTWTIMVVYR
jgi:hypothetical protein